MKSEIDLIQWLRNRIRKIEKKPSSEKLAKKLPGKR